MLFFSWFTVRTVHVSGFSVVVVSQPGLAVKARYESTSPNSKDVMPSAQHEPPLPLLLWTGEVLRKRLMVVGLKGLRLGSSSCPGAPSLDKRVRVSTLALSVNAHNHTFVRQVHKIGA